MDAFTLLATRAAAARLFLKRADDLEPPAQSAFTTLGNLGTGLGVAGAGVGYGSEQFGKRYLAWGNNPVKRWTNKAIDFLRESLAKPMPDGSTLGELGSPEVARSKYPGLESRLEWNARLTRMSDAAKRGLKRFSVFGKARGAGIGRAGLGLAGLGILSSLVGHRRDLAGLREHGRSMADIVRSQRGHTSGLQDQLGSLGEIQQDLVGGLHDAAVDPNSTGTLREQNVRELLSRARAGVGNWWQRMRQMYG